MTDTARILEWITGQIEEISCKEGICWSNIEIEDEEDVDMIVEKFDELFREIWYNSRMNLSEDSIEEIWDALREALKDQTERPDLEQYIDDIIEDRISKYLEESGFGTIEEELEEYEEE